MSWREWDRGGSQDQASALEDLQQGQDSGQPAQAAPPSDAPQQPKQSTTPSSSGDWKQDVSALGVDPGWVVALRQSLVEKGKVSMDDIQADALADPEHRKWLNRQMRKANEENAAAQASAGQAAPAAAAKPSTATTSTTSQPQPSAQPTAAKPSVLKPGHLPTGPLWQSTATPSASGWIPAKDGLWWPPWPVTGGPIQKPAVADATTQANAIDATTGQARRDVTGG